MSELPAMRNPVVVVHGIDDTSASLGRLQQALRRAGWTVDTPDLKPNNGQVGLEKLAEQIAAYVERNVAPAQPIDLIGFSMGGLVARYYAQRLAPPGRVERLITVSAPNRGTWAAFGRWNTGARQMRPGSRFLRELNGDTQALKQIEFTSIWSRRDLMIVPAHSSVMPEATNVRIDVWAHALMMSDARVIRRIEEALRG